LRLRTNIFLWVSLATVLPLTATVLIATAQSERLHRAEVDQQLGITLGALVTEIERRLRFEREFVAALATSPPLQDFKPVLQRARQRERHPEFGPRADRLAAFLEAFQTVVGDIGSIRVLDTGGNTLIRVRDGLRTEPAFDGIDPYAYAEEELANPRFASELAALNPGEIGYLVVPASRSEYADRGPPPMLDAVVPLPGEQGETIGYLMVSSTGLSVDRILELAPRVGEARFAIAEVNPDLAERDGLLLYDEGAGLLFSTPKTAERRLGDLFAGELFDALERRPAGAFTTDDDESRIYYSEYLPYPNQLVSWVISLAIAEDEVSAPFRRIRTASWLVAATALLLALGLAQVGARRIAEPICELASSLKAYAQGQRTPLPKRAATAEIQELRGAFDYMADTLERAREERDTAERMLRQSAKLASIGEMAAGIGHEINNPLNNMLSLAKLIKRDIDPANRRTQQDVEALIDEGNRASRIVRGILNFARQVEPEYRPIQVADWIGETVSLVAQAAREASVTLRARAPEGLSFEGDRNQLQQVLVNLLLNAIQASEAGGEVRIEAEAIRDDQVEIRVIDEGCGIDPQIMDKLFDPFFTTKPVGEGSGLGLSISLGIVEHHGGRLHLQPEPSGGVSAIVRLPAHPRGIQSSE
jgi:two-component system NtrC family sensor kinase